MVFLDGLVYGYRKSALYLAWKCLKSLCGGGGWWVLNVNLVISFGFGQAEQKDNNAEVQIDSLFGGIQYQRDVIQNKLTEIDASIKKIDIELEALTTKANKATEVSDDEPNSEVRCKECKFSCINTCDMKNMKENHECIVCGKH